METTTEPPSGPPAPRRPRARRTGGPDRLTTALLAGASILAVLGLLALQLRASAPVADGAARRGALVVRRIIVTKVVVERPRSFATASSTVTARSTAASSTVTAASSTPVAVSAPAAPVTRAS